MDDSRLPVAYDASIFYALCMRTTLEIPGTLLEEARKAARLSTKRETVVAGLNELLRKAKREDLRRLAGRIDLKIDLRKARQRPS